MPESNNPSHGFSGPPVAAQGLADGELAARGAAEPTRENLARTTVGSSPDAGYVVVLEVEYDAQTEREARLRAHRDAETLFQQPDVLAVTASPKDELFPITKAYLENEEVPE